ncbi:MAG: anti-sigma factor [Candidatus Kapabacteria bacterium]|nr:anti-sigma factor [Candidatus Kapabacteria bacterium]
MTHDELLNSGLLELYVADACTPEERGIVEQAMKQSPAVEAEIRVIAQALEAFAQENAVLPSPDLRAKALNAVFQEVPVSQPQATVYPIITRSRYLIAASIGLLIGALPSIYFLTERSTLLDDRNAAVEALAEARTNNSVIANKVNYYQKSLDAMIEKNVRRVQLPAVQPNGTAYASVFWNTNSHNVVIDARGLPELSADQDYQLWAIVDGVPVDLGVINIATTEERIIAMKSIDRPSVFAITVEPKGGRPTPTMEAMIVAGKVG